MEQHEATTTRLSDVIATKQLIDGMTFLRWTSADMAYHLGVSDRTVRRWRKREHIVPTVVLNWLNNWVRFKRNNVPPSFDKMWDIV